MARTKKTQAGRRSNCAVACTLDIIGDRWTLLVIRDLFRGARHFDDFLRSPEGIATNILSARLHALCDQGFAKKTADPADQRRFTYQLTSDGLHLIELLGHVAAWGLKYLPGTKKAGRFNTEND